LFWRNNSVFIDPALNTGQRDAQKVISEGKFTNVSKEAMCYGLVILAINNLAGKSLVEHFRTINHHQTDKI